MSAIDPTATRVRAALNALAEHGDYLALYLRVCGDRGQPRALYACPVSVHLRRITGQWVGIEPGGWEFHGRSGMSWGELPPEVAGFVREFDAGEHRDLIESAEKEMSHG